MALLAAEQAAIASVAAGASLASALDLLVRKAEQQFDDDQARAGTRACILLVDEADRFTELVAPDLPADYRDVLLHAETGLRTNPFGIAAFSGAPVFSGDIGQDQAWSNGRKDALLHGFRACWAVPVFGARGHVLGVFGLLFTSAKHPTQSDTELLNVMARGAAHTIERHGCEKSIADSEGHFRHAFDLNAQVLWTSDTAGQLDYVARRWRDWTGNAGLGASWTEAIHPDDLAPTLAAWRQALASGEAYDIEHRFLVRSGDTHWMRSRASCRRDEAGRIIKWYGSTEDINSHWEARAALLKSEAELRMLADQLADVNSSLEIEVASRTADRDRMWRLSTDIMVVADFNARIIAVNPAWSASLGRAEADTLGGNFMELIHPDDVEATVRELNRLASGQTTLHFENRYRHRNGSWRWISWSAVPADTLIHAIGRDITDEKAAREALVHSELALLQSQKLESIGKLTGGVAHDFNNVLQIISGQLQLLQLAPSDDEATIKRLDISAAAVGRGARLASQLLAFARRQPLNPIVTDLGRLLLDMEELVRRAVGDTVETEIVVGAGLWHTLVDPGQLENVLLNMAINARDAMDGRGRLRAELSNVALDDADCARHADVRPGDYVLLALTDTGHGMAAEIVGQIFEPFFTTKREGEGTGLGLSMAYGFVKQSGGHIKVCSEVGRGSTFQLYLPRSLDALAEMRPVVDGPVAGGKETILVVEDDLQVQTTVVDLLRGLGYTVLKANDAQSALTVVKSGIAIDLLFTDVVMPGELRSPDLARQAKQLLPELAVLFTSGYTQNAIVHGGRLDPGIELLSKPYRREELARKVRQLLSPPPPSVAQAATPVTGAGNATAPAGRSGRHVLLVEDNPDAREMTIELLRMLGHTVDSAGSAEEALAMLALPGLEILLTDITLPGMSGIELARHAASAAPHLDVIYSSGYDRSNTAVGDSTARFLLKPFSIAQLQNALQRA
jgi:PAS domain S-box-containing protein